MDQKIITLFDRFTHGGMNRRDFFERLTPDLPAAPRRPRRCSPCSRTITPRAALVPEDDPSIRAEMTEIAPGIRAIWCARRRKEPIRPYS